MPFKHAYLVPIAQGILYPATFLLTYSLSVFVNKDIPAVFPYVSDTGVRSLQRCIFSFILGIGSILMVLTVYIRTRQVSEILEKNRDFLDFKPMLPKINKISFYLAIFSAIGVAVLACFQVHPFIVVHLVGASCAFIIGWLVLVIQTYISFKIYPILGRKYVNIVRVVIVICTGLAMNFTGIFGLIAILSFKGHNITQWTPESGGYVFHLISVFNEWILVLGVVFYLTLYAGEFRTVTLYKPEIELIYSNTY